MKVLGLDPSLRYTGVALVGYPERRIAFASVVQNPKDKEMTEAELAWVVFTTMVEPFLPVDVVGIEDAVATQIQRAPVLYRQGLIIGGILALLHEEHRDLVVRIHPSQTKASLGKGVKTKHDVVEAVKGRFDGADTWLASKTAPLREAIADACGVSEAAYLLRADRRYRQVGNPLPRTG